MARWVPFTAYYRVVPHRGQLADSTNSGVVVGHRGSRFDYVRNLQKIAVAVYEELDGSDDYIRIGRYAQNDMRHMVGSIEKAVGVVPQFGNKPSLVSFEGFLDADGARTEYGEPATATPQVAPRITRISNDRVYQGYCGEQPWTSGGAATADVLTEIKILRDIIDSAMANVYDDNGNPTLWKLRYNGIDYGVGGHHLPLVL